MRSYDMMDWEIISDTHSVVFAIFSLAFSNAKIARVGVDCDARVVLSRSTKICHCTE
jgi:hypothetical protein